MKINYIKNLLIIIFVFLVSSCKFMFVPVVDFLKEYTEESAIEKYTFSTQYPTNSDNITCVSSNEDLVIKFLLRNPQKYELNPSVSFPVTLANSITLDSENYNTLTLVISKSELQSNDCGIEINPTINLLEPMSNRNFGPYNLNLICNTAPDTAKDLMAVIDNINNKYILCFNMPGTIAMGSSGIQRDIKSVTISKGNETNVFYIKNDEGAISFYDDKELSVLSSTLSTTKPSNIDSFTSFFGFPFVASTDSTNAQSVYYSTGNVVSENAIIYSIKCDDEMLSSSVSISTKSEKLGKVTISDSDGNSYPETGLSEANKITVSQSDDGNGIVKLSLPEKTTSVPATDYEKDGTTISYSIYNGTTYSNLYESGELTSSSNIVLPPGKSKIVTNAKKDKYVDSETVTYYCLVSVTKVYVSASGNDTNNGTLNNTYKTITYATSQFQTASEESNTIYVLSDITENVKLCVSGLKVTVQGSDNYRNPVVRTITAKESGSTIQVSESGKGSNTVRFSNLKITGGNAVKGGGVFIYYGKAILNDCIVSGNNASDSGAGIYVDAGTTLCLGGSTRFSSSDIIETDIINIESALTGTEPIATIHRDAYSIGSKVVSPEGSYNISQNDCNKFAFKSEDGKNYCVELCTDSSNTKYGYGLIAEAGISDIDIPFDYQIPKISIDKTTYEHGENIVLSIKDVDGNDFSVSSIKMTIYKNESSTGCSSTCTNSSTHSLLIPSYLKEISYTLYIELKIGEVLFTEWKDLIINEASGD